MNRLYNLDFLRGAAAFLVLGGHLRAYLIVDYSQIIAEGDSVGIGGRIFYLLTGLSHEAVIIFFALSGYLVGGKAFSDTLSDRLSWPLYYARRLSRLWIVLIPALLLTLIFDSIGLRLTDGVGYDGIFTETYPSGPGLGADKDGLTLTSFIGTLLFVQTIFTPTFGSNGPTWSLANEFWYYVTIPLIFWLCMSKSAFRSKAIGVVVLILSLIIIPASFYEGALIWTAGAFAALSFKTQIGGRIFRMPAVQILSTLAIPLCLVATKLSPNFNDLELGLIVALALPGLASFRTKIPGFSATSHAISEISYTLYLTHIPLLTLIVMVGFAPERFPVSPYSLALFFTFFLVAVGWSALVWWLFERHTNEVYGWVKNRLGKVGSSKPQGI
ncbi:acyltransferase family protein [Martelella radicis]|uniref:Peptidoglycan/LPS O-acetylase OafA/YrhL n=1 Tax=Martelella radicis TaxID=1397476 RepID=A0A7W6KIZ2_9HYPH|nr:acyltransferase [Martelella radicis]MBB4121997.1 peptidoglycan/LPS O-acetylase OafA/YrhL [Martelella radicis]